MAITIHFDNPDNDIECDWTSNGISGEIGNGFGHFAVLHDGQVIGVKADFREAVKVAEAFAQGFAAADAVFQDSPLVKAMQDGDVILDEVDMDEADVDEVETDAPMRQPEITVFGHTYRIDLETVYGVRGWTVRTWDSAPVGGRSTLVDFGFNIESDAREAAAKHALALNR